MNYHVSNEPRAPYRQPATEWQKWAKGIGAVIVGFWLLCGLLVFDIWARISHDRAVMDQKMAGATAPAVAWGKSPEMLAAEIEEEKKEESREFWRGVMDRADNQLRRMDRERAAGIPYKSGKGWKITDLVRATGQ